MGFREGGDLLECGNAVPGALVVAELVSHASKGNDSFPAKFPALLDRAAGGGEHFLPVTGFVQPAGKGRPGPATGTLAIRALHAQLFKQRVMLGRYQFDAAATQLLSQAN